MSDWCIENDFAAQRELADRGADIILRLRIENNKLKTENLELYKKIKDLEELIKTPLQ